MKPRIFVSSTFYDLKYIREDLSNYIKAHDFEPILFEDGDIGYTPGIPLDDACYQAMESTDMALLIIGGNYGSAATGEIADEFHEFISITRREFQKGIERGVPFFVFVDRNVYAEYDIYELNSKDIESGICKIKFKTTKNINVFRFIREILSIKQISIIEFDKVSDIKDFLSKQWSDMFKSYLSSIKEQKEIQHLQNSINSMNILIEKMDKIMDAVGKEIFKNSEVEYNQIIEEAEKAEAKNICLLLSKCIKVNIDKKIIKQRKEQVKRFLNALTDMYSEQIKYCEKEKIAPEDITISIANIITPNFVLNLEKYGMTIRNLYFTIHEEVNTIYPFLSNPEKMKEVYSNLCSGSFYYRIFYDVSHTSKNNIIDTETTENFFLQDNI